MSAMNVPFNDLTKQYRSIQREIDTAMAKVIESNDFIRGRFVEEFERNFATKLNISHCIGVGNGTDALFIALKALGIGPGDEVITSANSFIASAEAITMTGASLVFADCDPATFDIDPAKIEEKITGKTKAIIPVHLYGLPADMPAIMKIAGAHRLYVIEDSSQAHLAEINMGKDGIKKVGTIGDIGTFSFYPGKNLGAYGDAGALVTNNDEWAKWIRMFSNHGRLSKYNHDFEGINSRMDGIQGAILDIKLKHLEKWTSERRRIAAAYSNAFKEIGPELEFPVESFDKKHVYHLYVIKTDKRDKLRDYLNQNGIKTGVHYPLALPNLPAYEYLGHKRSDFPVAGSLESKVLSLPIYPELEDAQVQYVIEKVREFFS